MADSPFHEFHHSLTASLEKISHLTEDIYVKMAQEYPAMVRELDAHFQAAESTFAGEIQNTLQRIQDQLTGFQGAREESQRLLERFQEQFGALGALRAGVSRIAEGAILMELASLNALVVAARAGGAGRAFACITSELKTLSTQTKDLTERVAGHEGALGRSFTEFHDELEAINHLEINDLSDSFAQIQAAFETIQTRAEALTHGVEEIGRRSDQVKSPLIRIVVDVQNQDRIRQSIDHVLLSLQGLEKDRPDSEDLDARLDELAYLEVLPELSFLVLDEIQGQIAHDHEAFQASLDEAQRMVTGLEAERARFLATTLEGRGPGSLDAAFEAGANLLNGFMATQNSLSRDRESAVRTGSKTQKVVEQMLEALGSFDELLSRFRNIDLASRIEVARHSALAGMKDNAAATTELTKSIDRDVRQTILDATAFSQSVAILFDQFRTQFSDRIRQHRDFETQVKQTILGLSDQKDRLTQQIRGSRLFSESFARQFAGTVSDLKVLGNLLAEIQNQKVVLQGIKAQIADEKARLMTLRGVTEWKLDPERLQTIVQRFTIFTHKKFAAALGDFEVTSGVESGEVTLF